MKREIVVPGILMLILLPLACSETGTGERSTPAQLEVPAMAEPALLERYVALSDSGYALLDEGRMAEAVAVFTQQSELIPEGKWGSYNVACAYGRNGQVEEGIGWLTRAVENGWDDPNQLESDSDLDALRGDPRFSTLLVRAAATRQQRTAAFAAGLPRRDGEVGRFPDADSLQRWVSEQEERLRAHRRVWFGWQLVAGRLDLEARRLAALAQLQEEVPDLDLGLERVRAISGIYSTYEPWGALSDGVLKEVEAYLGTDPSTEGRSEAHYRAAVAEFQRRIPLAPTDQGWASMAAAVRGHLAEVAPGAESEGAAVAMGLVLELAEAGQEREALLPEVRAFAERFGAEDEAGRIAARYFQKEFLTALWPIPLDAVDLDGRPVSLDQYKGKVLLIDFWATWCPPCRRELPHLVEAYERFASEGFEILSISLDYADQTTPEEYRAWITERGMVWRHIYDQEAWKGALVQAFRIQAIPTPVLIGRDGKIAALGEEVRGERLAAAIKKALERPA